MKNPCAGCPLPEQSCSYCSQRALREDRRLFAPRWDSLHLYCPSPMSPRTARAGFQAESFILLYLNSDKLTCTGNTHDREEHSPVQALNPLPVLVYFLLPPFAMNPRLWIFRFSTVNPQRSGVWSFLGGISFLGVQSLSTQ